ALGRGGIGRVARLAVVHPDTVGRGARELERGIEPDGRGRRAGAGRPAATRTDPGLVTAVRALVDPETRGDPESPLRWTTKSTANLADALTGAGRQLQERGEAVSPESRTRTGGRARLQRRAGPGGALRGVRHDGQRRVGQ